jgi:hypothetical protein
MLPGNHYSCGVCDRDYSIAVSPLCPTPGAENKAVKDAHLAAIKAVEEAKNKPRQKLQQRLNGMGIA